jgi:hypothetical protein
VQAGTSSAVANIQAATMQKKTFLIECPPFNFIPPIREVKWDGSIFLSLDPSSALKSLVFHPESCVKTMD